MDNFSTEEKVFEKFTEEEEIVFARVLNSEYNQLNPKTEIPKNSQTRNNINLDLRAPAPNGVGFSKPLHLDFRYQNGLDFNLSLVTKLDDMTFPQK